MDETAKVLQALRDKRDAHRALQELAPDMLRVLRLVDSYLTPRLDGSTGHGATEVMPELRAVLRAAKDIGA